MTEHARWGVVADSYGNRKTPKYYHTTPECFAQLGQTEEDTPRTAHSLGMALCPDCEERARYATVESR